jgi:hypothetical protein
MRLELTLAAAALGILLVSPVRACGNGECDAPPPSPPPPVVVVTVDRDSDSDPVPQTEVIHFAFCCLQDGQPAWRTALFRDPVQAALQCQARALRYEEKGQSLPVCPHKLGPQP